MPKPQLITKGKFYQAYRKSSDVAQLAERLKIAPSTVYKYIEKYKLKSLTRNRPTATDKEVRQAAKKAVTINQGANLVNMAPTTFRQRCYRLGISFSTNKMLGSKKTAFQIIKDYWVTDIRAIALKFKLEERQVRHIIHKFSNDFCLEHNVPLIRNIRDFTLAHEIINNRSLTKDIESLSEITGFSRGSIKGYLKG